EDGIRDRNVTGVQTCALPISRCWSGRCPLSRCSRWACWCWASCCWWASSCCCSRPRCWCSRCGPRSDPWCSCSPSSSSAPRCRTRSPELLLAAPSGDRERDALPVELEDVLAGEAVQCQHAVSVGVHGVPVHPPFLADQGAQGVIARLGRAVGPHQTGGRAEPGTGVPHPPVGQRLDRGLGEHGAVVALDLVGLARLALLRGGPGEIGRASVGGAGRARGA